MGKMCTCLNLRPHALHPTQIFGHRKLVILNANVPTVERQCACSEFIEVDIDMNKADEKNTTLIQIPAVLLGCHNHM